MMYLSFTAESKAAEAAASTGTSDHVYLPDVSFCLFV